MKLKTLSNVFLYLPFLFYIPQKDESGNYNKQKLLNHDLIAFWDFNEGEGSLLTDYSGNNYHGKIVGIPASDWILGNPKNKEQGTNRAIDLAYSNCSISFEKINSSFNQFSLSIWLMPNCLDKTVKEQIIINSKNSCGPVLKMQDNGTLLFRINGIKQTLASSIKLKAYQWQNISVTCDNAKGEIQFFIDGKTSGSKKLKEKFHLNVDSSFVIGKQESESTFGFDGVVDDVVLYKAILSNEQIRLLANGNPPKKSIPIFTAAEEKLQKTYPQKTASVPVRVLRYIETADSPANPLEKEGYVLTRHDEFNGPVLDETLWIPYYLRQRVADKAALADYEFRNGAIILKVNKEKEAYNNTGIRISSLQTFEKPDLHKPGKRKDIPNKTNFLQQYGYFEIRAKTQAGPGNCSTFWLLGRQNDSTETGEIDVMEQPGHVGSNVFLWNLYDWTDPKLGTRITSMGWQNKLRFNRDLTTTFNIYGCEWTPTEIKLYVNNQLINTIPNSPQYPMGIFLSLYVGDSWTGKVDPNSKYPKEFAIDYFRAYQKK